VGIADAARNSVRSVLENEAERAVDSALAGPLPESFARSVVEHEVAQRVLTEILASSDVAHDDELERFVQESVARVLASAAFADALEQLLGNPAIRRALRSQRRGFAAEVSSAIRERTARWDDAIQRRARALLRRPAVDPAPYGGLVLRALALAVDAALAQLAFFVATASLWLVGQLAGGVRGSSVAASLAAIAWIVVVMAYFVCFWSGTGQTPGERLFALRVLDERGEPPSPGRSLLRIVALLLCCIPFFAGFLPVAVDARRRGVHDMVAGTVVVESLPEE
jgi:uncharacterized RDD family membrane protein YckC